MKNKTLLRALVIATAFTALLAIKSVQADEQAEKAALQRNTEHQIQDLQEKIAATRQNYKNQNNDVDVKVKEYQDRINEIKRDTQREMNEKDHKADMKGDMQNRLQSVRKDFYEWRFNSAITSYNNRISELKVKATNEADAAKKTEIEEQIVKLEAKNRATQAKLVDLKITNGDNWDKIQNDLDATLKDIDQDYDVRTR